MIGAKWEGSPSRGAASPLPHQRRRGSASTLSIVTTGRDRRQGCAVPPILPRLPLRCTPTATKSALPRLASRPLRGSVTPPLPDRQPASVSPIRRRFTCTFKPHAPRRGSRDSQASKRRLQRTGCPRRPPGTVGGGPASSSRSGRNDHWRDGFGRPSGRTERRVMVLGLRIGSIVPEGPSRRHRLILSIM